MGDDEVRIGRMPGHGRAELSWRLTLAGTALLILGQSAWNWVTDPETRPWIVGSLLVFPAFFACILSLDTRLDTAHGRLRHRRALGLLRWQVRWADATLLRLQHNHLGLVMLQARGPGRQWAIRVPVVGDDIRGERCQPVVVLRLLAEEIRRWAPPRHHGVADELDAQADHVAGGGSLHDSPIVLHHYRRRVLL